MSVLRRSFLQADEIRELHELMPGLVLFRDNYGNVTLARDEEFRKLSGDEQNLLLKQFIVALHLEAGLEV